MSDETFLGSRGLNLILDNPVSVTEVVIAGIGDELLQLFTDQPNLYQSHNSHQCRILPETVKSLTYHFMDENFLGLIILME
jgi:hypothetical protein